MIYGASRPLAHLYASQIFHSRLGLTTRDGRLHKAGIPNSTSTVRLPLSSMTWNIRGESEIGGGLSHPAALLAPRRVSLFLLPPSRSRCSRKGRRSFDRMAASLRMDLSQPDSGWNNDPRPQMTRGAYLMLWPIPASRRVVSGMPVHTRTPWRRPCASSSGLTRDEDTPPSDTPEAREGGEEEEGGARSYRHASVAHIPRKWRRANACLGNLGKSGSRV